MSILGKTWKIKNEDTKLSLTEKLFANRNLHKKDEIKTFLDPDLENMHDPFLMKDMKKAVARIKEAIDKKERIIIFGDYDVDGVTGTAILFHTLKELGALVSYRLPHRVDDGYGLNKKFIEDFVASGAKLIITVDCGIACKDEIELICENGIDVIVTDHHSIPEKLPLKACAILHPKQPGCKYPFPELTGAGVSFKLSKALFKTLSTKEKYKEKTEELLDLVTMGTIADLGPLVGENRIIVKYGLVRLKNTRWPGLSLLQKSAGVESRKMDTGVIGYHLAPRLNAAGRLSTPYFALQLLLEDGDKAVQIAKKLEKLNRERQKMTEEALEEAIETAEAQIRDRYAMVIWGRNWHLGIIGLIAGKLAQKYNRPAFVIGGDREILTGSVRSIKNFSAIAALNAHKKYLDHFGGHLQAGGFSIHRSKFVEFQNMVWQYAHKELKDQNFAPVLTIDCEITENDLIKETFMMIDSFNPFGMANEEPVFLLKNVNIKNLSPCGIQNKHLRMQIDVGNKTFKAIGFDFGPFSDNIKNQNKPFNIALNLRQNEWRGEKSLEFNVIDLALTC